MDGGGPSCSIADNSFTGDTLVSTPDGDKPIEDIEVGDIVLAYNEETGEIGEYPVTHVWSHEGDESLVTLSIDGEIIIATAGHPFYTADGEWIAAGDLQIGAEVTSADGTHGTLDALVITDGTAWVYNLTVDEAHTYFVGDGQWLVHNTCPIDGDGGDDLHQPSLPGFERSEDFVSGELNVGTYNQLRRQNVANGYNQVNPHHIPQTAYMEHVTEGKYDYGTSGGRGIAINVQVDRHALTTTFNNPPDYTLTPLQTLTRDINDLRRIYRDAGLYNDDVEQALQEVIRLNMNRYPSLFGK